MRDLRRVGVAFAGAAVVVASTTVGAGAVGGDGQRADRFGTGDKVRAVTTVDGRSVASPNPYLALLPEPQKVDYAYWRDLMDKKGKERAASPALAATKLRAGGVAAKAAIVHDEEEPAGASGFNDIQANAEPIDGFGTGSRSTPAARVLGSLKAATEPTSTAIPPGVEDEGSIPLATQTGLSAAGTGVTTTGMLGDGPHGTPPDGDGTADFDVYAFSGKTGQTVVADTSGTGTSADTMIGLYDAAGTRLDYDDDGGSTGLSSRLQVALPADGLYYVFVVGYSSSPWPADPFNSGSGASVTSTRTGTYQLALSLVTFDADFYSAYLKRGDVLGGSLAGNADTLQVFRADGAPRHGSQQDASSLYSFNSPLPGGGNAVIAYVAEEDGWYGVKVNDGEGGYDLTLEAYRSGSETDTTVQTVFLDFDGARVNTGIWGGPGVRTLTRFNAFLPAWGLTKADESAVIDKIVANVTENLKTDLKEKGFPRTAVRVLNSRDNADPFGKPNVSRVIIGGTIAESGIGTIGIAQTIDPGNFGHEDSALVLLDVLSDAPAYEDSLNYYMTDASDRIAFVGQGVGNVVSHEVGHMIGSYHVDQYNDVLNLMNQGGANYNLLYGVGPDGVGGTADDWDVDFGEDTYNPNEGFFGQERTDVVSAFGQTRPRL